MTLTDTGGVAILFSIYLAYISKFVLGAWCLFCIGLYGVNVVLTLLGSRWTAQAQKEFEPSGEDTEFGSYIDAFVGGKDNTSGMFMTGFLAIAIAGLFLSGSDGQPQKQQRKQ